jgi:hypothetical protein
MDKAQTEYEKLFVVCKECDHHLQERLRAQGYTTSWEEVGDLFNPILFLKNMLTYMNMLYENPRRISEEVHKRMKEIYIALAQRTLREVTKEDIERFKDLRILDNLGI